MNAYHHNAARADDTDERWSCPYPHQKHNGAAPNPAETDPLIAAFDAIDTVCTEPTCLQPVQFCPACGTSNRSLAKFCRACRQPLAFEDAMVKFQAAHEIDAKRVINEFRQVELPDLQGRPVSAMVTGWGYTLLAATGWGLGVQPNTHLESQCWLSQFEIEGTETITAFCALRHADLPPGFLAIGAHQIYRIDLLPERQCKTLFRIPDPAWTISGTALAGALLVVRVCHRQSGWHRWLLIDCKDEQIKTPPLQQRGEMSDMISLAEPGKLMYHTIDEIVQIDVCAGSEQRQPGPPCGLNLKVRPQFFARTGEVFLCGLDGVLYRCNLAEGQTMPEIFGRGRHELVHMFLNAYDDYLYLLCRDNLVLIDYPSGSALWNSQQHLKTLIHCGNLQPQQWGNYLMFSVRNSGSSEAAERVALFSFEQRSAPLLLHPAAAQMPAPVAGVTNLIAARKRREIEPGEPTALLLFQF
ncbi:MAG: hypothetical protein ACREOO_12740 [bacterium]